MWRKPAPNAPAPATVAGPTTASSADRVPLAPAPAGPTIDLSVVVVFYNMRREAARTLHALSRSYQRDIEDLDYEVLVYENGSAPDQLLGEDFVRSFGPEFRYVDLGADASPSPTLALNRGIAASRGETVALMIDGAHVLSPGVLHFGMQGSRAYAPALVGRAAVVRRSRPAARHDDPGLRPDDGGPALRADLLAGRRLSAVRGRPLHRRPRLVRRPVGEQLRLRAPQAPRAGGRVRRHVLDARCGLRQPRHVRAAGRLTRRAGGDDPRRGLVPPAPRRHDHEPLARRRPQDPGELLRRRTTRSCGAGPSSAPNSACTTSGR